MVTDQVPGHDSGYGIRVRNVIDGLRAVGDLHVCLIDSSTDGAEVPAEAGITSTRLRLHNPRRWAKGVRLSRLLPANVRYRLTRAAQRALRATLGPDTWDLVWCSRARVHVLTHGIVHGPRIVDLDDISDSLLRSEIRDRRTVRGPLVTLPRTMRDLLDIRLWSRLQRRIARQVERLVVCSGDDCAELGVANCAVVPNGYPLPAARNVPVSDDRGRILFVGPLTYEPNRLAVEWFVKRALPTIRAAITDVEFVVVGDDGSRDDHSVAVRRRAEPAAVTFTGWAPDVTPFYEAATIAVTPLHSGGGTRIKVIEALARGVPLVSTAFACAGHGLEPGRHLLVADDADDFAAACLTLLGDAGRRERLAAAGLEVYCHHLTAAATSGPVAELARSLIDVSTAPGGH